MAKRKSSSKSLAKSPPKSKDTVKGQLRIGDHGNAIAIIATSQSNPLKAVAEFVENSIDAKAKNITISRGKEGGEHYLRIVDDGNGIPLGEDGKPDFKYVATHICDSIKRQFKKKGEGKGLQGEFGIGLLSFWTVGEELVLRSAGADNKGYQMIMKKGSQNFTLSPTRQLIAHKGTELTIAPLLSGLRQLSGEKLQWYLAYELRNRILESGVQIKIIDRTARTEFRVEPKKFTGQRLPIETVSAGEPHEVSFELYLSEPSSENRVSLFRRGTRVLESVTELDPFQKFPWNSGYLQGIIEASHLSLTPGTRLGLIQDSAYETFCSTVAQIESQVAHAIEAQRSAEEEKVSRETLVSIQRAFREAFTALPVEEYDWFDVQKPQGARPASSKGVDAGVSSGEALDKADVSPVDSPIEPGVPEVEEPLQRAFFDFPGPLYSVRVSPSSTLVPVNTERNLRAVTKDRKSKAVTDGLIYHWELKEGAGALSMTAGEIVRFVAPSEPGITKLQVSVLQGEVECRAEATVTVVDMLLPTKVNDKKMKGLPGYTYQKAPGELWRSRYDEDTNLVVINNGHRDFVFSSQGSTLKLRYLCRLFAKELVQKNFVGMSANELMERLIEVSLYVEEKLR